MTKRPVTTDDERLARIAKAMGHPTRIAILEFLAKRDECFFGEIHEILSVSKATVSQHLTELKDAGLIQGTIMPPKVRYCIDPVTWKEAQDRFHNFFKMFQPAATSEKSECRCQKDPEI